MVFTRDNGNYTQAPTYACRLTYYCRVGPSQGISKLELEVLSIVDIFDILYWRSGTWIEHAWHLRYKKLNSHSVRNFDFNKHELIYTNIMGIIYGESYVRTFPWGIWVREFRLADISVTKL